MKKFSLIVLMIGCSLMVSAALSITRSVGWLESAAIEFTLGSYEMAHVYIAPDGGDYTQLDLQLVRRYNDFVRADALGLKAGVYTMKVVPVKDEAEVASDAVVSSKITVKAYDRTGYAHFGATEGIGAYNNDGTLKANARVLYVSQSTAKTVKATVVTSDKGATEERTGIQNIIQAYEKGYANAPLCIRLLGTVSELDYFGSSEEGLQIKGNDKRKPSFSLTVEGVGNDAVIRNWGILLREATCVELRNFAIMNCMDDCISLDTNNDRVWVHHLDGFYGQPGSAADQVKGDGCIDVKGNSKHVTIGYCHFWDSGKSSMCGMHQDSDDNWITYTHNWFDHSDSRHPRIRTMSVHMLNNFYDGNAKYGVGVTSGGSVFVEANYYKNCSKPMLISKQGTDINMGVGSSDDTKGTFSGEEGGIIKSFGNVYSGSKKLVTYQENNTHFDCWEASAREAKVPAEVKSLLGGHTYNNFDTDSRIYSYTPDKAEDVPSIVTGQYGAGRMEHGDFSFAFTAADDASSEINTKLKEAIIAYTSSFAGILGGTPEQNEGEEEEGEGQGGGGGSTVTGGSFECHFTGKKPSSTFYTISGNYSDSKGKATVNGTEYTICLKMESSTSIKFTLEAENTIYLHFADTETGAKIKIDGTSYTATNAVITQNLAAGAHEITRDGTYNLFYINMLKEPATGIYDSMNEVKATKFFHNGQLLIIRDGVTYDMMGRVVE